MPTLTHPSNQLYNGEVTNFLDAMRLYRQQLEHENRESARMSRDWGVEQTDFDRQLIADFKVAACKADEAAGIYRTYLSRVNAAVVAELRAKNDSTFDQFADALEAGDFSMLAV